MNPKTFSKLFVKSFLFGLALLCVVGISSTDAKAQKITIKKDFCQSVGAQNTCNGNLQFQDPAGTVNFTITPAAEDGTTTVGVLIDDEGLSSGTSDQIPLANDTTFTVCEVVPMGFRPAPRPDESTGGISQTTPPGMPNCIRFTTTNSNGNFDLKFINLAVTTAATATISGRVKDINGKSAARVSVTITNVSSGEVLLTRTDLLGRYAFTDLATGEDYLLRVFSGRRSFKFNEIVINLVEDLTDADFTTSAGK
ncbi:MAG: carboxypeptidase-like regulatory domain-containing protein [Pyrinomonadaceae bacterium]